jgi:hypothetical protein
MTQIVLNPEQLSQTASALDNAAGEYQAIGAQVYGCDCGCMPADVASVVDSVTADVRGSLQSISSELGIQASDLAQRAGVSQDGGFTAVGAASGGPATDADQQVVIGGGFDTSVFGNDGGGYSLVIGGGFDTSVFGSATDSEIVVGGGFDTSVFGSATDSEIVVGGGFDTSVFGSATDSEIVVGGGFDTSVFGSATDSEIVVGGGFEITPSYDIGDSLATLMGMAAANNDTFSQMMLWNIQNSMNMAAEVWTLPDGWGIGYGW